MNIHSVLKIHTRDKWLWLYVPSIILLSSFLLNFVISFLMQNKEAFYTGGVASIFVYVFTAGIIVVLQTFPYAISMSLRRRDYFLGTALLGIILSFASGIVMYLSAAVEASTNYWGNRFHFFHFPYLNDGTPVEQIIMYVIFFIHLFFLGSLIGSFSRRFGGKGLLLLSLCTLLAISAGILFIHYYDIWGNIFTWFKTHTAVEIAYWLFGVALFYMLGSYLLLRRAAV